MIYVSQGHEIGIGLEVFLKSFLCLNKKFQANFVLVCYKSTVVEHQKFLPIKMEIIDTIISLEGSSILNCIFLDENIVTTQTTACLNYSLEKIHSSDILLTLPSSKDQFFFNKERLSGHTEYFRTYYGQKNIGMTFLAEDTNVLLLTDHISIDKVIDEITYDHIIIKVKLTLNSLHNFREINEIFFTGINPHCGEGGEISHSDKVISQAVDHLQGQFPKIKIHEMVAGDTVHFNMKSKNQLFIYAFHDQGLAPFKLKYGLSGINFTSGLPFKRVSVDHGTSFPMYGKNTANYSGMLYLLNEIEKWA